MTDKRARQVEGRVVSDAMDKSIVVLVEGRRQDKVIGKYVKFSNKFCAHDEDNQAKIGDRVILAECRPMSKRKSWVLVNVIESQNEAK